jgi:hypothetical protein
MERALKSFLDGISEDDNVVNLETAVKNDNEDEEEEPESGVIAQGSASGMLDMRAMAQRYQEMSSSDIDRPVVKAQVDTKPLPLPGQLVRDHLLAPVVEVDGSDDARGVLIAGIALAVLVCIVSTAAITAVIVKRSVMAEIREMGLTGPPSSVTQNPATMATAAVMPDTQSDVAQWPETDPAAEGNHAADDEDELNFRESDVETLGSRTKHQTKTPAETNALATAATSTTATSTTTRPTPVTPTPPPEKTPTTNLSTATTTPVPTPTPAPKQKLAKDGVPCDEVLCFSEGRGCCGTAKQQAPEVAEVDTSLPERLDRDDIKEGLAGVDGRLSSCGTRFDVSGVVTLKLSIAADGRVKQSSVNKGEQVFQSCVSDTLKRARFIKTQQGANLSYPVIMR